MFFGEPEAANDNFTQHVRIFDFDLQQSVFKPIVGDEHFVDPVAATYRVEDDAYYILDKGRSYGTMRLIRMHRGQALEVLGTWRNSNHFDQFSLTSGIDGTLALSTSNASAHNIAILALGTRSFELKNIFSGTGRLALPAQLTPSGLSFAAFTPDGDVALQRLPTLGRVDECEARPGHRRDRECRKHAPNHIDDCF